MYRVGKAEPDLTSRLGYAAKLAIHEARNGPIYARYSTDLQNDRSIEDQLEVCKTYALRNGWADCVPFADRAASGTSEIGRPNYAKMVEAARRGEFDIILSEDLDRFSRNLVNIAQLAESMAFAGVEIWTIGDGLINRAKGHDEFVVREKSFSEGSAWNGWRR